MPSLRVATLRLVGRLGKKLSRLLTFYCSSDYKIVYCLVRRKHWKWTEKWDKPQSSTTFFFTLLSKKPWKWCCPSYLLTLRRFGSFIWTPARKAVPIPLGQVRRYPKCSCFANSSPFSNILASISCIPFTKLKKKKKSTLAQCVIWSLGVGWMVFGCCLVYLLLQTDTQPMLKIIEQRRTKE